MCENERNISETVKEYMRATVQVGMKLVRVYCHHEQEINIDELEMFFEDVVSIIRVQMVEEFDLDEKLEVVMIDESGIYFW